MISFIVIGKNEGWKLTKCFSSIHKLIDYNKLKSSEIIYIDSDSQDDSIAIAKSQEVNLIYKIQGKVNAAIARNTGSKFASGSLLFFLDGDIELKTFDLSTIIKNDNTLKFSYVVGYLDDLNYDAEWNYVNQNHRHSNHRKIDKVVTTVGGAIFIISKSQWNVFNGMDERLFRTQDRDLSLRMARKGIKGIRKSEVFGLHHTIPYNNYNRMILMLTNGSYSYKGIMIRKHLANTAFYPVLLREESSMIFLSISIVIGFFYPILFILYILIVVFRNIKHFQNYKLFVLDCLNRILKDIIVLASIIFYHPTKSKYTTLKIE